MGKTQTVEEELQGARAVVTGSSSGIGRAVALELAAAGADVLIHARANRAGAEEVADRVRGLGRRSAVIVCDLADPAAHENLVSAAWEGLGDVEIWINNAGADVLTGEAAGWSFDQKLERLWRVDVQATVRLSRLVGRRMQAAQGQPASRSIVNVGWDQADFGMAGDSGEMFAAVKGAVMAFTRSLAKSLAPAVRVNGVAPGWIRTAWGSRASESWQQRGTRESLLGRWGAPTDVARVVRFLASPAAAFVNGQMIHINGGFKPSLK